MSTAAVNIKWISQSSVRIKSLFRNRFKFLITHYCKEIKSGITTMNSPTSSCNPDWLSNSLSFMIFNFTRAI